MSDQPPADWAKVTHRRKIAEMPARAAAARRLIDAAKLLRAVVGPRDQPRSATPAVWHAVDAVCDAIDGYK